MIAQSLERRYDLLDAQSRVMGHLNAQELRVYDDLHEGKTRKETCQAMKMGHSQYTKIRGRIKELFIKYL